jgi:hypothetical protein
MNKLPTLLPHEIVHRILEYDGRIKYRNGKYMNQISQDDERYEMLQTLPKIIQNRCDWWNITILTRKNIIYIDKRYVWYSTYVDKDIIWYPGKEDPVIVDGDTTGYYSFAQPGFCYKWSVGKLIRKRGYEGR